MRLTGRATSQTTHAPQWKAYLHDELKRQSASRIRLGVDKEWKIWLKKNGFEELEKLSSTFKRKRPTARDPITDPEVFFSRYDLLFKLDSKLEGALVDFGNKINPQSAKQHADRRTIFKPRLPRCVQFLAKTKNLGCERAKYSEHKSRPSWLPRPLTFPP